MSAPEPDWSSDLANLAEALTRLLTTPQGAAEVDLDVAAAARAIALHTAAATLRDLAPRDAGPRAPRHLAEVEHDPLTALVRLLAHRPRPVSERSPGELLDPAAQPTRRANPATRAWMDAGRHALAAGATWTPQPRHMDTDWAWRTVADLAGICEAVAVLDTDLHPVAVATGRADIADLLSGTTGLRLAAAATRANAAAQPEPVGPAPEMTAAAPRIPPGPAVVNSPATLVEGLGRVTAMISAAQTLTPAHVHNALRVARDLSIATAAALPERRDQLDPLTRRLHTAMGTASGGELATLLPSTNPGIDHQLGELHRFTRDQLAAAGAHDPQGLDRAAARPVAGMLPGLIDALTDRSHAQVGARRWAIRDHSPRAELTNLPYRIASTGNPQRLPPLLPALHAAAAAATELREVTTTRASAAAAVPAPHRTLGEAIHRRAAATPLPDPSRPPARRPPGQRT